MVTVVPVVPDRLAVTADADHISAIWEAAGTWISRSNFSSSGVFDGETTRGVGTMLDETSYPAK